MPHFFLNLSYLLKACQSLNFVRLVGEKRGRPIFGSPPPAGFSGSIFGLAAGWRVKAAAACTLMPVAATKQWHREGVEDRPGQYPE